MIAGKTKGVKAMKNIQNNKGVLSITQCEHEGNQNSIVMRVSIEKSPSFLSIEQFDKDSILLTQEDALQLVAYILVHSHEITTDK